MLNGTVKIVFRAKSMGKSKTLSAFPLKHQQFPQIGDFPPSSPTFPFFIFLHWIGIVRFRATVQELGLERKGVGKGGKQGKANGKKYTTVVATEFFSAPASPLNWIRHPPSLIRNKFSVLYGKV